MIVARARRTIEERQLLDRGDHILVGCSGGPDSAALLAVLWRLRAPFSLTLTAASVHHGLRADADHDVRVAEALAARFDVPFVRLEVELKRSGSVQARAREARYAALLAQAQERGAGSVAVGHTRDDQAETVLSRMLRGAGMTGLAGIAPRRADSVIRPLIDCARSDVLAYVAQHSLPHCQDPSNEDRRFERVRLRSDVLGPLAVEDPRVIEHLAALADEARGIVDWGRPLAAAALDGLAELVRLPDDIVLGVPAPVSSMVLAQWVWRVTGATAKRAHVTALTKRRGEVALPDGWMALREEKSWVARRSLSERGLRPPLKASDH